MGAHFSRKLDSLENRAAMGEPAVWTTDGLCWASSLSAPGCC